MKNIISCQLFIITVPSIEVEKKTQTETNKNHRIFSQENRILPFFEFFRRRKKIWWILCLNFCSSSMMFAKIDYKQKDNFFSCVSWLSRKCVRYVRSVNMNCFQKIRWMNKLHVFLQKLLLRRRATSLDKINNYTNKQDTEICRHMCMRSSIYWRWIRSFSSSRSILVTERNCVCAFVSIRCRICVRARFCVCLYALPVVSCYSAVYLLLYDIVVQLFVCTRDSIPSI